MDDLVDALQAAEDKMLDARFNGRIRQCHADFGFVRRRLVRSAANAGDLESIRDWIVSGLASRTAQAPPAAANLRR